MTKKLKTIITLLYIITNTAYGYDELLKNASKYTESGRPLIYLKASIGAALLKNTEDPAFKLNMKSKPVPYFSVGVGTYFMDNSRIDLTFEHVVNPALNKSSSTGLTNSVTTNIGRFYINDIKNQAANVFSVDNLLAPIGFIGAPMAQLILQDALTLFENKTSATNFNDLVLQAATNRATQNGISAPRYAQSIAQFLSRLSSTPKTQRLYDLVTQNFSNMSVSTSVNHKAHINAFMVNGSLDIFEFNRLKFFIGAGLGGAQLKEKVTITSSLNINSGNSIIIDQSTSTKKANNFAYSLALGTSTKVADKVTMELVYRWKDFGKTKSAKVQEIEFGKTPYRSHALTVEFRVEL